MQKGLEKYKDLFLGSDYKVLDSNDCYNPDIIGDIQNMPEIASESIDAIICKAVLEHVEEPTKASKEIHRVLRPGGTLLASNRRGLDAFLMPRRAFSADRLRYLLAELSLVSVEIKQWQTYYDLVWARKEGALLRRELAPGLEDVLRCPRCAQQALSWNSARLACGSCGSLYPIKNGIIRLGRGAGDITPGFGA